MIYVLKVKNTTYSMDTAEEVIPHAEMVRNDPKLRAVAIIITSPWHLDIRYYVLICYKIILLQNISTKK